MAAMTKPGRVMGPLKAGDAGTMAAALGAVVGSGNFGGAAVGMAADVGMLLEELAPRLRMPRFRLEARQGPRRVLIAAIQPFPNSSRYRLLFICCCLRQGLVVGAPTDPPIPSAHPTGVRRSVQRLPHFLFDGKIQHSNAITH